MEQRPPFTEAEDSMILEISRTHKNEIWMKIANSLSAIGMAERLPAECHERFKSIKRKSKIRASAERTLIHSAIDKADVAGQQNQAIKCASATNIAVPAGKIGAVAISAEDSRKPKKPNTAMVTNPERISYMQLHIRVLKRQLQVANLQLTYYNEKLRRLTSPAAAETANRDEDLGYEEEY